MTRPYLPMSALVAAIERELREQAEQAQRRADARAWQLAFNRLFPKQAVPV